MILRSIKAWDKTRNVNQELIVSKMGRKENNGYAAQPALELKN